MESFIALNNCIRECEELIRMLQEDCEINYEYFDGEMMETYHNERERQLDRLKDTCDKLQLLKRYISDSMIV